MGRAPFMIILLACLALGGCLLKRDDATLAIGDTDVDSCPAYTYYRDNGVESALQQQCVSCHTGGGGTFRLIAGAVGDDQVGTNYLAARAFITDLVASDLNTNPILGRPLGQIGGHTSVWNQSSTGYADAYTWVVLEACAPCGSGIDLNTCF